MSITNQNNHVVLVGKIYRVASVGDGDSDSILVSCLPSKARILSLTIHTQH